MRVDGIFLLVCCASAFGLDGARSNPARTPFIGISSVPDVTQAPEMKSPSERLRVDTALHNSLQAAAERAGSVGKSLGQSKVRAGLTLSTLFLVTMAAEQRSKSSRSKPVVMNSSNSVPSLSALQAASTADVAEAPEKKGMGIDFGLLIYFALWYLGNYYYNITNKLALKAAGGKTGFPMMISGLQLGVGCIYAIFMWLAPDARKKPSITMDDLRRMVPVAFCFMGAHTASVFAMGVGAVSFAQIVKAAEPAFAAVLSQFVYGRKVSKAKWLCLPIVIGGVVLASVKELDFAWAALFSACIANMFAAVRGNENKKLMEAEGIRERLGSVGNQFAITTILGFLFSLPVMLMKEGSRLGEFIHLCKTQPAIWVNLIASGLYFYAYNELATMTLKKTGAVTQSVANTAKRVIVIVGVALVLGESLSPIKLIGCAIGIGGVFLYSIIDNLVKPKKA